MAEFSNPRGGFVDTAGNVLAGGSVYFYTTATTTLKDVYSDVNLTTAAANPVVLDGSGHPPLRYLDGTYAIIVKDADGVTQPHYTADPIGGNPALFGAFGDWNSVVIYSIDDTVQGSDGLFYQSLVNSNLANDPTDPSPTNWSQILHLYVYNASDTYAAGDVVVESTGLLWKSVTSSNIGNTPNSDGGTNWLPAVSGADITEVATLETRTTTVVGHTGGGALTALRINELRDGNSGYTLPLANSVSANQMLWITLPARYATGAIVTRAGSDTIEGATSDTTITFAGPTAIQLTSDGSSEWTITAGNS